MLSIWMVPVFAYCIWVGRIFTKRCTAHWMTFLFFPTLFMIVAFVSLLVQNNGLSWYSYLICLWSGCVVGLLITNPVPIKIDLMRQTVSAPGSRLLLVCLMTLCVSRCAFDWLYVSMPEYLSQLKLLNFCIKGTMTGVLYGQALSFWYRLSLADKYSADQLMYRRFFHFYGLQMVSPLETN